MGLIVLSVLLVWTSYNIPILIVGARHLRQSTQKKAKKTRTRGKAEKLPIVSLIVPVKDEETVIGRLLEALLKLDYPLDKKEIVIVEGGSKDKTVEICRKYVQRNPQNVKLITHSVSKGKPSALNIALKHVTGSIVGVFDADNIPEDDMLVEAIEYFKDSSVAAIQGRTLSINADENMLTKMIAAEEAARFEVYLRGKDKLGLYLPFTGSCQFIRKEVLTEVDGWNENSLAEDVEISVNLTKKGYHTKYAPNVRAWQENPASLRQMVKQRLRWYTGWIEVAAKYGELVLKPNKKTLDAEVTLATPFILPLCLTLYFVSLLALAIPAEPILTMIIHTTAILNVIILFMTGLTLFLLMDRKLPVLSWLLWTYVYWSLHIIIASYALLTYVLGRRRKWNKTDKTGTMTNLAGVLTPSQNPLQKQIRDFDG